MGPTWQSVSPSIEGRIPTAPPGPRNDGRVHKVRLRAARRVVAPHANDHCYLSCRAPEGRRVKDAAPCRFTSFDTHRTTGKRPVEARLNG